MGQVTAVGQVQAHDAVMGLAEGGVHGKVTGRTRVRLDVAAPVGGGETVRVQGTLLAEQLDLVDELVAAVVTGGEEEEWRKVD